MIFLIQSKSSVKVGLKETAFDIIGISKHYQLVPHVRTYISYGDEAPGNFDYDRSKYLLIFDKTTLFSWS